MPQVFKIGPYWVYFWSNEGRPLEPVHVHVAEGSPAPNATKICCIVYIIHEISNFVVIRKCKWKETYRC